MRAKLIGLLGFYIALLCGSESGLELTWLRLFQSLFIGWVKVRQLRGCFAAVLGWRTQVNLWIFLSLHRRSVLGLFHFIKCWFVALFFCCASPWGALKFCSNVRKSVLRALGARNFCSNVRKIKVLQFARISFKMIFYIRAQRGKGKLGLTFTTLGK